MNMTRINYVVYIRGWEISMVFNRNCFRKMTDFSRLGALQAVTYTVKVVVSNKWREMDTLLLHTTNRKYRVAYLFVPFPVTLDDLEGVIRLMQDLSNAIPRTFVQHFLALL